MALLQGCATTPPPPTPSEAAQAQAKEAYLLNDYQRTLAIVEPLAIAGEPWAQYTLGYMYHYGRGVAVDRQMAKQWITRAAEQGYAPAQEALKRLSKEPLNTETDIDSSAKPQAPPTKESTAPPSASSQTPEPTASPATVPPPPMSSSNPASPAEHTEIAQPQSPSMAPVAPANDTAAQPTAPAMLPRETSPMAATEPAMPSTTAPPAPTTIQMPSPSTTTTDRTSSTQVLDGGIKGNEWIEAQDPQHYTLQLIGSSNKAAVIRFIHKNGIEKEAAYYAAARKGQPWYSVVYGNFPDPEAAHQALQNLPSSLHRASPWVRSFKDIRASMTP